MAVSFKTGGRPGAYGRAMRTITPHAQAKAWTFLQLNARLIDRHRYACHFTGGSKDAVVAALRGYANPDGGFGHALEPDLRGASSQPQPVEVALRLLDEIDAFDDPMVEAACDHLDSITRADGGVPFVLPSVRDTERAPWWNTEDDPPGALNPTAALAGLLHRHGVDHPWLDRASEFCWSALERGEGVDPYTARAVLTFLDGVPDRDRAAAVFTDIRDRVLAGVEFDPAATGEKHFPLDFAPATGGFGAELFSADVLAEHLDALVAAQEDDGGWTANWAYWTPVTEFEWRGFLTVSRLLTLRAYGRLAG
jgi:hypothetical protein